MVTKEKDIKMPLKYNQSKLVSLYTLGFVMFFISSYTNIDILNIPHVAIRYLASIISTYLM
jgi:hypothetical protein